MEPIIWVVGSGDQLILVFDVAHGLIGMIIPVAIKALAQTSAKAIIEERSGIPLSHPLQSKII
ncbi:MAG: hypothetical protein ACHQET_01260 [Chitinophagales bacterium]